MRSTPIPYDYENGIAAKERKECKKRRQDAKRLAQVLNDLSREFMDKLGTIDCYGGSF